MIACQMIPVEFRRTSIVCGAPPMHMRGLIDANLYGEADTVCI